jgi:Fic family protein
MDGLCYTDRKRGEGVKPTYVSVFKKERKNHMKNGLYDYFAVNMTYHTGKIEGSTLTLSDTQALFERNVVPTGGHRVDDIIESRNHFELIDFMLETIDEPLNERLIKEFHQLLKKGTTDEKYYGVGDYKKIPNIAGTQKVAQPHEVHALMTNLLKEYTEKEGIHLKDIITFHHAFELIHPFQDGNGRVGRMMMMRECLRHPITPFIISSERREEYIHGLKMYGSDPAILMKEATMQQQVFQEIAEPFLEHYSK